MLFYYFGLLIAAAIFSAISYVRPRWGIYLIAGLLPTYLIRFNLFGIPFTWLEAMILLLALVVIIRKEVDLKKILADKFFWPIIAVLIAATIAVFVSPDKLHALGFWKAYFVEPIIVYWLMLSIITIRRELDGIFWSLGVSAIYLSLIAFGQKIFAIGVPQAYLTASGTVDRVVSVFGYPNALGLFLGPIIILFLGFLFYNNSDSSIFYSSKSQRFWFKLLVIALSFITIVLAQSEGAILAVLIIGWLMLFFTKKARKYALLFLGLFVIVFIFSSGLRELVITKALLLDYSGEIRRLIWGETWNMLKNSWFFGAGLAGYPIAIIPYHSPAFEIFPYPHNILLNLWSELGLLGVAAFVWLGVVFIWENLKNIFCIVFNFANNLPFDKVASFVFLAVGFEMLIHGLVDVPYFKNDLSVLVWLLIGVVSLNNILKKE